MNLTKANQRWIAVAVVLIVAGGGYLAWQKFGKSGVPDGIASGNGRIEATEIDISTKTPGRIREIMVSEGDFVTAGQVLARMDTDQLEAQRRQAIAQHQRARVSVDTARSLVAQRNAERTAAVAVIAQREAQLDSIQRKLGRSEQLITSSSVSQQVLDDDRANTQGAKASVAAAQAQLAAADAAISAANAQVIDAGALVDATQAAVESITVDINDATLKSPATAGCNIVSCSPAKSWPPAVGC